LIATDASHNIPSHDQTPAAGGSFLFSSASFVHAAGSNSSIALTQDGSMWQWRAVKRPVRVFACRP
jgi:hypothetical protein